MATEEYYKARFTGIADMGKVGAADGLIARQRDMAAPVRMTAPTEAEKRRLVADGEKVGAGVVNVIAWAFPVWSLLAAYVAAVVGLFQGALALGMAPTAGTLPDWYLVAAVLGPAAAVAALRRWVRAGVRLAMLVLLGLFLGAVAVAALVLVAAIARALLF